MERGGEGGRSFFHGHTPNTFLFFYSENIIEPWGLEDMCNNLIRDLNEYGVCVLDNFLGYERGLQVLREVDEMYAAVIFKVSPLFVKWTSSGSITHHQQSSLVNYKDHRIALRAPR